MRLIVPLCFALASTASWAQDDQEFGQGLADRGYMDLAEEIFKNAAKAPGANKTEAEFNIMRLKVAGLGRIGDPKARLETANSVVNAIREYISQQGDSPKVVEAYGLLSDVYQMVGKTHVIGRDMPAAEKAFGEAVSVCKQLVDKLKEKLAKVGDNQTERESVDKQVMFSMYNYILAQFAKIDALKSDAGSRSSIQGSVTTLEKFFEDFMWNYEAFLLALDASTYMGRAFQILAEMQAHDADYPGAEQSWRRCFMWIGKGKTLGNDKSLRSNEEVREVVMRASQYEMIARIAYGNMLRGKGGAFKKQYQDAVTLGDTVFKWYPEAKGSELGINIQLEYAKALMRVGETKRAKAITDELLKLKDPKIRERVAMVMGEFAGAVSPKEQFILAEEAFMSQSYYSAVKRFQETLVSIKDAPDRAYIPKCWMRIGECYYQTGRFFEAIQAFAMLAAPEFKDFEDTPRAITLIVRGLRGLEKLVDDPKIKADREKYEKLMNERGIGGDEERRGMAVKSEREGKYAEAIEIWSKIAKDSKDPNGKLEAMSRVGFNRWKLAEEAAKKAGNDWTKVEPQLRAAIEAFKAHLDMVRQNPGSGSDINDIMASMYFGSYALSRLAKDEKDALAILEFTKDITEKFSGAKTDLVMSVLSQRVEANIMRRKPFEAETDFLALEKLYEKSKSGLSQYKNSITSLAQSFDREAKAAKDSDKVLYDKLFDKSLEYFRKALDLGGAKGDSFDSVLKLAELAFMTAEKQAQDSPADAKKKYIQARELYDKIMGSYKDQVKAHPDKELEYKLRHRLVKCYLGEGDFVRANAVTDTMLQDAEDDIELLELKGDILMAVAKSVKGNDQVEKYKSAGDFYGKCAAKYKRVMGEKAEFKTAYYRNLYSWCLSLFEYSDGQTRLSAYFESAKARGEAPEWDGGEYKAKLNQMMELIEKKIPKK